MSEQSTFTVQAALDADALRALCDAVTAAITNGQSLAEFALAIRVPVADVEGTLSSLWGGQQLNIPKGFRESANAFEQRLFAEFNAQNAALAKKHRISERTLHKAIQRAREALQAQPLAPTGATAGGLQAAQERNRLLCILQMLHSDAVLGVMNSACIKQLLHTAGHVVSSETLRTDLYALAICGLLTTKEIDLRILVVRITERGCDVASGVAGLPTIGRPAP